MAALAQAGGGLEHLVNGAGVELVELEDLQDLHRERLRRGGARAL
jgi:hypothetical protein